MFLAYLAGTASSRAVASLALTHGRRRVLLGSTAAMLAGLGVMLAAPLWLLLAGLVLLTAGFFGAHAIASGWTGAAAVSGRAQAASLYNLAYYAGSSLLGWATGLVFEAAGWAALTGVLAGLLLLAAATAAVALPGRTSTA